VRRSFSIPWAPCSQPLSSSSSFSALPCCPTPCWPAACPLPPPRPGRPCCPTPHLRVWRRLKISTVGFSINPASITWTTGSTSDVTIAVSAVFPSSAKAPKITYGLNGTDLDFAITLPSSSSGSSVGWSAAFQAAATVGAASAVLNNDAAQAIVTACGLLTTGALLAQGACSVGVNVSITLPAGVMVFSIPATSPTTQVWYSVAAITNAPTVPTASPTIVSGANYLGCFAGGRELIMQKYGSYSSYEEYELFQSQYDFQAMTGLFSILFDPFVTK